MRIAYDHSIFTRQRYGGISRYVTRLMAEMLAQGHQAMALTPVHGNAYLHHELPAHYRGCYAGSRFYRVKGPFIYLNGILGYAQAAFSRPDILHETYYAPWRTAPRKIPLVVTVHDMTHELYPDLFAKGDPSPALKRRAVHRADHVICISGHTRKDLLQIANVPDERISVIHHGFQPLVAEGSEDPGHPLQGRPYILFVGGREGYKNFQGLLNAYAQSMYSLGDAALVAFGPSPFNTRELTMIRALGLEGRVHYASGDDRRLAAHYRHARVFMFPSLYEGFGFPLLESMSLGCPVGASRNGALPEVGGDAARYFDPTDPNDMAKALVSLWEDDALRNELISRGHRRAAAFTWSKCAVETLAVYRRLIY